MRNLILLSFLGVLLSACGAAASDQSVCPQLAPTSTGAPPACPEGCEWSGKECRKTRGIIVPQAPDTAAPQ